MIFPERLASLLKKEKMSQRTLADDALVSRAAVAKWLAGTVVPNERNLHLVANRLGVSAKWLRTGQGDREPKQEHAHPAIAKLYEVYRARLPQISPADLRMYTDWLRTFSEATSSLRGAIHEIVTEYKRMAKSAASQSIAFSARAKASDLALQGSVDKFGNQLVSMILEATINSALQKSDIQRESPTMNVPTVDELLRQIRLRTIAPGAKIRLAKNIGVRPQQLSAWLKGTYKPSGDVALKIWAWVDPSRANQQTKRSPEDARTSSERETQLQESKRNENQKARSNKTSRKKRKSSRKGRTR